MAIRKMKKAEVVECLSGWVRDRVLESIPVLSVVLDTASDLPAYKDLELANIRTVLEAALEVCGLEKAPDASELVRLQARIHAIIGPGFMFLPGTATTNPSGFYVDTRCGRTKGGLRRLYAAVKELKEFAVKESLDPAKLPELPSFHNCGIW